MTGDTSASRQSSNNCPDCGSSLSSISDMFTGRVEHIDNFDEVEDELRERGVVSDTDPILQNHTTQELEEAGIEPRDGTFISESICCTETWCDSRDCDYSRRTWKSPEAVAEELFVEIASETSS